jgi:hypothetical protein
VRILAVTSWGGACGIANYAEMLRDALVKVAPDITLVPFSDGLDPSHVVQRYATFDLLWLNYHSGLHSRWTPEVVRQAHHGYNKPIVITFHDTYGERPPDALTQQLHDLADAFVVHEPCVGLDKQVLIRQGVPAAANVPAHITMDDGRPGQRWFRPMLGTCGFNFPWKNFDRLAEVTAEAGWAYMVLSNNATDEDGARWKAANPYTMWRRGFIPTNEMVAYLSTCDATCFAYECANSGTSGAIRLGLAARKPVLAFSACRQMRDLYENGDGQYMDLCTDWGRLISTLRHVPIQRVDPGIAYLAHRDSWVHQGRRYAEVFRGVLA